MKAQKPQITTPRSIDEFIAAGDSQKPISTAGPKAVSGQEEQKERTLAVTKDEPKTDKNKTVRLTGIVSKPLYEDLRLYCFKNHTSQVKVIEAALRQYLSGAQ